MTKRLSVWLLGFFLTAFSLGAAPELRNVQLRFSPSQPAAGEPVSVFITAELSETGGAFDFSGEVILPPLQGASWQRNLNGMQISSTREGTQLTFQRILLPDKEGKLSIPPIRVRFHGAEAKSAPAELTVLPAGSRPAAGENTPEGPSLKARFLRQGPFRPGETAELEIELISPLRFVLEVNAFPSLANASGIRLLPLPYGEEANKAFRILPMEKGGTGENRFHSLRFTAKALFLLPGKWEPEVTLPVSFRTREFFAATRTRLLTAKITPFSVLPRPAVPAGVWDTGLLGKWNFSLSVSSPECRTGEGTEVTLLARDPLGNGSAELFRPPVLEVPGCRIYPPEVRREARKIILRYALVPLQEGKRDVTLRLAAYDPAKNRNSVTELPLRFTVARGTLSAAPELPAPPHPASPAELPPEKKDPGSALYPWQKLPRKGIVLPLLHNTLPLASLLAAGGVLLLCLPLLSLGKRSGRGTSPEVRHRRALLRTLRKNLTTAEDAAALFHGENLAAVAEALRLPAGSTAGEIAGKVSDPELQRFFAELSRAAFAPGAEKTMPLSPALQKKLRKFLSALLLFFLLLFPLALPGAEAETACAQGDYAVAEKLLRAQQPQGEISSAFCCNMGFLSYQQGKKEAALLWFTRATLLAPRDPAARGNRELAALSLSLEGKEEEKGSAGILSLRDLLRPDHYFLLAALTLFLLGLTVFLHRRLPRPVRWWGAGVLLFLLILWGCALYTQSAGPYSPRRLMLMGEKVEVRAMPSWHSASLETLSGGTEAELLELRPNWMLIRSGETNGWIPAAEAERVFPYGLF